MQVRTSLWSINKPAAIIDSNSVRIVLLSFTKVEVSVCVSEFEIDEREPLVEVDANSGKRLTI